MTREEMLFKGHLMADLMRATATGAIALSVSQMQAATNIATAIFSDMISASPVDQQSPGSREPSA